MIKLEKINSAALIVAVIVLLALFGSVRSSSFEARADDYTPGPSSWGPDDEIGNVNYLTPELVREAAALIKTGEVFDLGTEYYEGMPGLAPRSYKAWLLVHGAISPVGKEGATLHEEYVTMSTGIGTQLDGFAHAGSNRVFYNGVRGNEIIDPAGARKFGMEKVPPIVTRGVLVDMVACQGRNLEPGEGISLKDFLACLEKLNLRLKEGDAPLINTGWLRWSGVDNEKFMASSPGITQEVARYLVEKGVVGVGTDQWTTEKVPAGPDHLIPSHVILLGNGIHLFQNLVLAELAKRTAELQRYEFFFSFTHPKLKGTVQGIGQPIAIM